MFSAFRQVRCHNHLCTYIERCRLRKLGVMPLTRPRENHNAMTLASLELGATVIDPGGNHLATATSSFLMERG